MGLTALLPKTRPKPWFSKPGDVGHHRILSVMSISVKGYTTDRDVCAAQVVAIRGLAALGHRVKMLEPG